MGPAALLASEHAVEQEAPRLAGDDRCFFDLSVWDGQKHNTVKL